MNSVKQNVEQASVQNRSAGEKILLSRLLAAETEASIRKKAQEAQAFEIIELRKAIEDFKASKSHRLGSKLRSLTKLPWSKHD